MKNLSTILLLVCLLGCKSNKASTSNNPDTMEKSYLEVAKEELGEGATCEESKDKAYVLCMYVDEKAQPPMIARPSKEAEGTEKSTANTKGNKGSSARVKYFVWNTTEGNVVKKGLLVAGNIMWHSNTELKIIETKGANLPADVYLYNIETQKTSPLNKDKP